jgi:uncharacterized protein (TIGR03084 family)
VSDIFDDLAAEYERLDAILAGLTREQWLSESDAPGWTITEVMIHLAQTEEAAARTVAEPGGSSSFRTPDVTIDERAARLVAAEQDEPEAVFERWRAASRASVDAMRSADPTQRYAWATNPLNPRTLATTRLAEHWAHALDITVPLDIPLPDTDRLRHIAWLGHRTLPYGFAVAEQEAHEVCCELTAPDGVTMWRYGPPECESRITGDAGAFCRVGALRLSPDESGLATSGPHAAAALRVLRNYAA